MSTFAQVGPLQHLYEEWHSYCSEIQAITAPLYEELNITVVRYSRTTSKNQKITLVNNTYWLEQYFKEQFYIPELIRFDDYQTNDSGISLHGPCKSKHPTCVFWNKHADACNYKYILCMYERYENNLELFDFAIHDDDHAGGNKLINNINLLKHFKIYFKAQANEIITKASTMTIPRLPEHLARENFLLGLDTEKTNRLLEKMPIKEIYLDGQFSGLKITLAEAKCLKLHMEGYKYKEIGKRVGISSRTVETHIYNMRKRFGISDKHEFIQAIHQHGVYEKLMMIDV